MCGIVFTHQMGLHVNPERFVSALKRQRWRGPDNLGFYSVGNGKFLLGHNRLSIIDAAERSNQPFLSDCGRYGLLFNGEVYNHAVLRKVFSLDCKTASDTETVLQGIMAKGSAFIDHLDGMFALVFVDFVSGTWLAARDFVGIKPLYLYKDSKKTIISSEAATVSDLAGCKPSSISLAEWRLMRRPVPGHSFFNDVHELLPGKIYYSDGRVRSYWSLEPMEVPFVQEEFENILQSSIQAHQMSDFECVSLLSGGIDSSLIASMASCSRFYSVGVDDVNEFESAMKTAAHLGGDLIMKTITREQLVDSWQLLTRLKREPIYLPNEGLIYAICSEMRPTEKVVLTGEGADELLFGYDRLYRWSNDLQSLKVSDFLSRYSYSGEVQATERLVDYIDTMNRHKTALEFVEDFFLTFHLPGLLRRMDFSSMAASKEARVPFVNKSLVSYLYRQPFDVKIAAGVSKLPARRLLEKRGIIHPLTMKKVGFSATPSQGNTRSEYDFFQNTVLGALKW